MNEDSVGTPNPLSPDPQPVGGTEPSGNNPTMTNIETGTTASADVDTSTRRIPVADAPETVQVESLSPDGRTMEQVAKAEPPKKSNKGLIIGLIIGLVILIGGAITAAVLLLNNKKEDVVAVAMNKLLNNETPSNVAIDGKIDILFNSRKNPIRGLKIDLDSDVKAGSAINTSSAVLDIETWNNGTYSVQFDEVYASDSDLYFKLDGLSEAIEGVDITTLFQNGTDVVDCNADDVDCVSAGGVETIECNAEEEDCSAADSMVLENSFKDELLDTVDATNTTDTVDTTGSNIVTNALTNSLAEIFTTIDGKWLRISSAELGLIAGNTTMDSSATCVVDLVNDLNKTSNSTIKLYNEHPFIKSTTEGVVIPSKDNPVHRVQIDDKNFAEFVNGIDNPTLTGDLYRCLGWQDKTTVTPEDVAKETAKMPAVYVEVNGNHEFSRIYLETDTSDASATVTLDLNLSYPERVTVSEPIEYTDFSTVIQEIMSSMYTIPGAEGNVAPVEPVTE